MWQLKNTDKIWHAFCEQMVYTSWKKNLNRPYSNTYYNTLMTDDNCLDDSSQFNANNQNIYCFVFTYKKQHFTFVKFSIPKIHTIPHIIRHTYNTIKTLYIVDRVRGLKKRVYILSYHTSTFPLLVINIFYLFFLRITRIWKYFCA